MRKGIAFITAVLDKIKNSSGQWIEEPTRAKFTRKTLIALSKAGYETVVVYSPMCTQKTLEIIRKTSHAIEEKGKGLGESFRQGLAYAPESTSATAFVWMEPEKVNLVPFLKDVVKPVLAGKADMVVVGRKDNIESYPSAQAHEERFQNEWVSTLYQGRLTKVGDKGYFDWSFGPFAWSRAGAKYCFDYAKLEYSEKDDIYCSRKLPAFTIRAAGGKVVPVSVNYKHPREWTRAEEHGLGPYVTWNEKRLRQLEVVVKAVTGFLKEYPQ